MATSQLTQVKSTRAGAAFVRAPAPSVRAPRARNRWRVSFVPHRRRNSARTEADNAATMKLPVLRVALLTQVNFNIDTSCIYGMQAAPIGLLQRVQLDPPDLNMSTQSGETQQAPGLLRSLTLVHAVLYGLGVTIGAGIYVLVGVAAGRSGMHAPLAFSGRHW